MFSESYHARTWPYCRALMQLELMALLVPAKIPLRIVFVCLNVFIMHVNWFCIVTTWDMTQTCRDQQVLNVLFYIFQSHTRCRGLADVWAQLCSCMVLQVCCHTLRSVEEAHLSHHRSPCKQNPELSFTTGPRLFILASSFAAGCSADGKIEPHKKNNVS